jgi:hypothetical protein
VFTNKFRQTILCDIANCDFHVSRSIPGRIILLGLRLTLKSQFIYFFEGL